MRLKYEPSLEQLLITAKPLFSNRELYRSVQLSVQEFSQWSVVALKRCTTNLTNGKLTFDERVEIHRVGGPVLLRAQQQLLPTIQGCLAHKKPAIP